MRADTLRTAVTLYRSGTVDIAGAARSVGVSPARMRRCLWRNGVVVRGSDTGSREESVAEPR